MSSKANKASKTSLAVATRVTIKELAKARDGLIARGIKPNQLMTRSQILRLAIYLAITMTANPEDSPSEESLNLIERM